MNIKKAVLVLGYNNTRVEDVKMIKIKAERYLNAITVLCKKSPTAEDNSVVDYTINVGLEGTDENVQKVLEALKVYHLSVVALLPFSDQGTQLGAFLAKVLKLNGPDINKVGAALDKHTFRNFEQVSKNAPKFYRKVRSEKINSFEHLNLIYNDWQGMVFLKPAQEGNSRGCINLNKENNIKAAWQQVEHYLAGGIVAEELISNCKEYSWDYVNGFSWITEKKTTQDQYRAEYQQIVPAPLKNDEVKYIKMAGRFLASLAGANGGACHNEIFFNKQMNEVIGVEPNLRPAGMKIWDLATLAFNNFDPWKEWILWAASNNKNPSDKLLESMFYSGIRLFKSPKDGILGTTKNLTKDNLSVPSSCELIDLVWSKQVGDKISKTIKDNSNYVGYIIARAKNYDDLIATLDSVSSQIEQQLKIL